MIPEKIFSRDIKILEQRVNGATLTTIAEQHTLSEDDVSNLLTKLIKTFAKQSSLAHQKLVRTEKELDREKLHAEELTDQLIVAKGF